MKTAAIASVTVATQPRQPIGHVLKCWPQQFNDIMVGEKHFEIRKDDRDFARGDLVVLVEFDPEAKQHTGRSMTRTIGYLGRGAPYPAGYCAFWMEYGDVTSTPTMNVGRVR